MKGVTSETRKLIVCRTVFVGYKDFLTEVNWIVKKYENVNSIGFIVIS
jgi:hypothetical protein